MPFPQVRPCPIAQSVALQTENRRSLVRSPARPIFFPRIDDSHCDRIHSFLIAVRCFDDGYVGKQPVAWKEYCAEYFLKEIQESMDRCTGRRNITETLLKTALNTIQSINQSILRGVKTDHCLVKIGWLVVLRFNATLTAKVISWRSVTHMCFLVFSHQHYHKILSKATDYFSHMLKQR